MFGQGIYFATDSSKSGQEIYTKGSQKLLLCDVLTGKCKTVHSADPSLCRETLQRDRFDSVYAIRDSKTTGGVLNDEFVIFDPRQAIVRFAAVFEFKLLSFKSCRQCQFFVSTQQLWARYLEGVVSRPKSGRVEMKIGMAYPDFGTGRDLVRMAYPDLSHVRG